VSKPASGFQRALSSLRKAGVELVVVGVGGINFYARTAAQAFQTLDLDALLPPSPENLGEALRTLSELGYTFEVGGEPFVDLEDRSVLGRVVANGACLSALHAEAGQIDLMTSIAGFSYGALSEDATTFSISGVPVRVGRLEKLLRAKQMSGRPKDLAFLRAFEAQSSGGDDEGA